MFLNKPKFVESLFNLFDEADKELVLVVPYVKMSKEVYNALVDCDRRGIEICMVCRTDCLHANELEKLKKLTHITLLTHPNLHSKIYLNQKDIIVGSMNLYEYSQTFNREAGYMFERGGDTWSNDEAEDCLFEIKQIISGSEIIIASEKVLEEGVDFSILRTEDELLQRNAKTLSKFFTTKTFTVVESPEGTYPTCISFFDQISVVVSNRAAIYPRYSDEILKRVLKSFQNIEEHRFENFRTYIDYYNKRITLYAKKGEYIPHIVYRDRQYAKSLEMALMTLCKELDVIYKRIMVNS